MKVKNAIALVTGANRGIGRAFVEELLAAGAAKVYLGVRRPGSVEDFAMKHPGRLVPLELDVTNPLQIKMAAQKAQDITLLINNAGVFYGGALDDDGRMQDAHQEMDVNYFGTLSMTRAFIPVLAQNGGGAIVNISSIAGLVPFPGIATYCASKAAVHLLTMESRLELAPKKIHVMGVYPGPVDTDMTRNIDMPKVSANHVARGAIEALEAKKESLFPDPYAKDLYALFCKDPKQAAQKIRESFEPAIRAA